MGRHGQRQPYHHNYYGDGIMNDGNQKTVLLLVLALCLVAAGWYFSGGIHRDGGTANGPGNSIQRASDAAAGAGETIDDAEESNRRAQETAEGISETNRELQETADRNGDAISRGEQILEAIRKQRKEN